MSAPTGPEDLTHEVALEVEPVSIESGAAWPGCVLTVVAHAGSGVRRQALHGRRTASGPRAQSTRPCAAQRHDDEVPSEQGAPEGAEAVEVAPVRRPTGR